MLQKVFLEKIDLVCQHGSLVKFEIYLRVISHFLQRKSPFKIYELKIQIRLWHRKHVSRSSSTKESPRSCLKDSSIRKGECLDRERVSRRS